MKHKNRKREIVVASGYFDPLHVGHLEYLEKARDLGDRLIVIVNTNTQAFLKKGFVFMDENDRCKIVNSLKCVDDVVLSHDADCTVCETLKFIRPSIFAKGGDRTASEIPEAKICEELGIKIVDALGPKIRSSSQLVQTARCQEIKSLILKQS